jgi:serine/threonine protein phosphatase 1
VRPGIALEAQTDEDLLWIREPFLSLGPRLPLIVVHGHTPSATPEFAPGRIGIDTGCFATGRLTILKVDIAGAGLL